MQHVKQLALNIGLSVINDKIKGKFLSLIIKNLIWNLIFIIIVIFNVNIYSINLILLYYIIVYGILIFGISKLIFSSNNFSGYIPNIMRQFKLYLIFLLVMFLLDFIITVYEFKFEIYIYLVLIVVTFYMIKLEYLKTIYHIASLLLISEPKFKLYIAFYIVPNIIASGIYIKYKSA
jgi:hypothetical protein